MRVKSKQRSLVYRFISLFKFKKLSLLLGRGYLVKGEELSEETKRTSPITILGAALSFLLVFFLGNYANNFLRSFVPAFLQTLLSKNIEIIVNGLTSFPYYSTEYFFDLSNRFISSIMATGGTVVAFLNYRKLSKKFDRIDFGQEGDARLATLEEVKNQYKAVPDIKKKIPGVGGVPVTHNNGQYFIDTNTVNSLVLGTSRSGKGESLVFAIDDILSRAEEQSSMIFNDPKGELYVGSKETLEKRGYEVQVLNILNPDQSMSYNPLQLITDAYIQGDHSSAQMLVDQFSYALFNDPNAGANRWVYSGAQKLLNGVILALIDYHAQKGDLEKVTMYNVAQWIIEMSNKKLINPVTKTEKTELDLYFERLPQGHIAKAQYSSFSSMDAKNKGPIQSAVLDTLTIFQGFEAIAKMTSKNSFKLKSVGFPKSLLFKFDRSMYDKRMKVRFYRGQEVIGRTLIRPNMAGVVDLNFNYNLKTGDFVEIDFEGNKAKYSIKLLEKDGELTLISSDLKELESIQLFYTEKPIAVFMITPDFDPSKNVLSSMFVKQLYTILAQSCSNTRGNKCFRRVHFILDEFGNMPAIESMDNIVTVCLGRNILFNLFVQSYTQLANVYGENTAKIIKENCQNHLYILSQDSSTHEEISSRVGSRTVERRSRTEQDPNSLETSQQYNVASERVITPYRISTLVQGEMVCVRLHRTDLKGKKIRPYAIFSTKETAMPFRYEFLSEYFDPSGSLEDFDIPSEHKQMDLKKNALDIDGIIDFSVLQSSLLSDLNGLDLNENRIDFLDEAGFEKALIRFTQEVIDGYKETVQNSLENEELDILSLVKKSRNESNGSPFFTESERMAFLQYANCVHGEEIYRDIPNLVRLDEEFVA